MMATSRLAQARDAVRQSALEARLVEFAEATRDGIAACRQVLERQAVWAAGQNQGGAP